MYEQLSLFDVILEKKEPAQNIQTVQPEIVTPRISDTDSGLCPYPIPTVAEIMKQIERESYRISKSKLISDIFECGAICISNQFDFPNYEKREQQYLQIINTYEPKERELIASVFAKIFALLSSVVYKNGTFNDYLGELFMNCNQGNKNVGQFFTPYHISKCMAKMSVTDDRAKQNEITRIYDPCCGSGGMVLASLDVLQNDYGVNYAHDCFVLCHDIDIRCVYMAYLQLSLAGVPAIITHQDTLTQELWSVWKTPAYLMQYLRFRRFESYIHGVRPQ